METFIAIDVETANSSRASICQIGLVAMTGSTELWRWSSFVNPEEEFASTNYKIHRIHPTQIVDAPKFPEILEIVAASIAGQALVSYGDFDHDALTQAVSKYGVICPPLHWLDVRAIARQTWPYLSGYGLVEVCEHLSIAKGTSHHALEDAVACAKVFHGAMTERQNSLAQELAIHGQRQPVPYRGPGTVQFPIEVPIKAILNGPLSGHVLLLTGDFEYGKMKMGRWAAELGCDVNTSFTKEVSILVHGGRDVERRGTEKSEKHQSAEAAMAKGRQITIWSEAEFLAFAHQELSKR